MPEQPHPGDQPLPTEGTGPGMHDLVTADLDPTKGRADARLVEELKKRRDVGLARYGSLLQVGNGRDATRDLLEECLDGAVYARQASLESSDVGHGNLLRIVEGYLLDAAAIVLGVVDAREREKVRQEILAAPVADPEAAAALLTLDEGASK